jgi:hypothetical protein
MSDSARHSWICGKRNTSNKAVDLVRGADVLVENYRGRKLGELGLSPETVAELRPGIIYASLRGFGWEGPWLDRGGFDMDANCATGFAALEETADAPQLPATVILNDYLAGSDLAGCSGGAGPTGKVRGQLSRPHVALPFSMWYSDLGVFDRAYMLDTIRKREHQHIPTGWLRGRRRVRQAGPPRTRHHLLQDAWLLVRCPGTRPSCP